MKKNLLILAISMLSIVFGTDVFCATWYTGSWSDCSEKNCGEGIKTRTVECRDNGKIVDDFICLCNGYTCDNFPPIDSDVCYNNSGCYTPSFYDSVDSGGGGCFISTLFNK